MTTSKIIKINCFTSLKITDSGLIALSDQNRGLEVLFLNNCSKISDDAIIKALACLARLRKLGLLVSRTHTAMQKLFLVVSNTEDTFFLQGLLEINQQNSSSDRIQGPAKILELS